MKISEFSGKYNVSNDTVRYYMKLNLLIPEKKGGHYHFHAECERDMEEIIKLKKMDFSLQEIKEIFNYKRIGRLTTYQRYNYYQELYRNKIREIEVRLTELTEARAALAGELAALTAENSSTAAGIGIGLNSLPLFCCPACKGDLFLSAEKVEQNQILEGSLNCSCGETLLIKEGILYAGDLKETARQLEADDTGADDTGSSRDNYSEKNHIASYIQSTKSAYMDETYQALEWMQRRLDFKDLSGKIIMEPGSGYGHFLRHIYNKLPDDAVYICIDNDRDKNRYLKDLLERGGRRINMVFLTAELPLLPLKAGAVDLLVDFTGTSSFSFKNKGFLPRLMDCYLKEEASLLAQFIIYHKFGPGNVVAGPYRRYFIYQNVRESLLELDFKLEEEYRSEIHTIRESPGKYEDYAQPGDKIYSYQVLARRANRE